MTAYEFGSGEERGGEANKTSKRTDMKMMQAEGELMQGNRMMFSGSRIAKSQMKGNEQ